MLPAVSFALHATEATMGKSWMKELHLLVTVALWFCDLGTIAEAQSVLCYEAFDEVTGSCNGLLGDGVSQEDCCMNHEYSFQTDPNAPCRACRRAAWTQWSPWSACSVSCTEGVQRRKRTCYGQAGQDCEEGLRQWEMQSCSLRNCCPVMGGWSEWGAWSPCSVTCAKGFQTRERPCNNPVPACGGVCPGNKNERRECDTQQICPTHGNWGSWGNWEPCHATCMPGGSAPKPKQQRWRQCNSPRPSEFPPGNPCQGQGQEFQTCTGLPPCPEDGNWGAWKASSPCSVTCGVGRSVEKRLCDNPAPRHGGRDCSGPDTRMHICNTKVPCPVDGFWTEWTPWSLCSRVTSDIIINCKQIDGLQKRTRVCKGRAHNGKRCGTGSSIQTRSCYHVNSCLLPGSWTDWSPWGLCEPPCGENPQRTRKRECKPIYPNYPMIMETENGRVQNISFWGTPKPRCQPLQGQLTEVVERIPCQNVPPCKE